MDNLLNSAKQSLSSALLTDACETETERIVRPFNSEPIDFPLNSIKTSRFTALNFLPKAFFEQFRRLANVYFLVIGAIAIVGTYSNYYKTAVEPAGVLLPMTVVILISVVKEGLEDFKRHRTDAEIDARRARRVAYDGRVESVRWDQLTVGTVVLLLCDDAIPADVVVVSCGGIQGPTAYVETAAIDGESNLKIKLPCYHSRASKGEALRGHKRKEESSAAAALYGSTYCPPLVCSRVQKALEGGDCNRVDCSAPQPIQTLGSIGQAVAGVEDGDIRDSMIRLQSNNIRSDDEISRRPSTHDPLHILVSTDKTYVYGCNNIASAIMKTDAASEYINAFNGSILFHTEMSASESVALSGINFLLRGSMLKATEWCIGIVTFTGADTKLALNSKKVPSKLSSLDRVVNKTLLIAIAAMTVVCGISALFGMMWDYVHNDATYLCLNENDMESCESSSTNSTGLSIFTFATLYNNFVCISMYVSLEMIYIGQSYFITKDLELYDATTDTPAEVHASGMCADLGQVQYVLSDKTGTITKNVMKLRRCTVGGMIYGAPMAGIDTMDPEMVLEQQMSSITLSSIGGSDVCGQEWATLSSLSRFRSLPAGAERSLLVDFLRTMAACNTVMLMPDVKTGELNVIDRISLEKCLQAESADEVALVSGAVEFVEVLLTHRDIKKIVVKGLDNSFCDHPSNDAPVSEDFRDWVSRSSVIDSGSAAVTKLSEETYEVLAVNVFDSDRKRMSVLLRMQSSYVLLCKGADSTMLPLCMPNIYFEQCSIHIDQFAMSGLRTLVFAKRILSEIEAMNWIGEFHAASNSLVNRSKMLVKCAKEIEQNLELLGAVGVEDELQDGVAEAIKKLQDTGLNVWMITGDKTETALAIGRICGLMRPDMVVETMVGLEGPALRKRLMELSDLITKHYMTREEEDMQNRDNAEELGWSGGAFASIIHDFMSECTGKLRGRGQKCVSISTNHISKKSPRLLVLAVDGMTLEAIWSNKEFKAQFQHIVHIIQTVIACRVSPLQKASLVRLVKMGPGQPVTLAVGDGANDIGMIHEARIGVGISGREGRHASNSADFAIGQFRFLVPLLLKHGRYNYIRGSKLVLYSFFKNLVLVSTLFYYCNYSGFSGTVYIDTIVFSGYNFYLGLPIVIFGIWDQDIDIDIVLKYPNLAYQTGRCGELLSLHNFLRWCLSAFFHGWVLFAVVIRIVAGSADIDQSYNTDYKSIEIKNFNGRDGGIYVNGFLIYTCVVVCMQMKIAYMTNVWTWIHWICWLASTAGFLLFAWSYSQFGDIYDWYKVVDFAMGTSLFYLGVLVIVWLMYIVHQVLQSASAHFFPSSQDRLRALADLNCSDSEVGEIKKHTSGSGISMPERKPLSI